MIIITQLDKKTRKETLEILAGFRTVTAASQTVVTSIVTEQSPCGVSV